MPYKLSPSSLHLLEECPRCFWLHHNLDKKRPESIFPSLPSGMDRILKIHFDKFRDQNKLPPELDKNKECKECSLFNDKGLMEIWRDYLRGVSWADENKNILRGAIDNILVKGKKLIVLDYKTRGYPLKENTHEYYQDQLDVYNLLLRKNNYETEDYAFLLFYIPEKVLETGEVIFNTELVKMKISIENAEILFNKAIKLLNGPCPAQEHSECEWCKLIESKK